MATDVIVIAGPHPDARQRLVCRKAMLSERNQSEGWNDERAASAGFRCAGHDAAPGRDPSFGDHQRARLEIDGAPFQSTSFPGR